MADNPNNNDDVLDTNITDDLGAQQQPQESAQLISELRNLVAQARQPQRQEPEDPIAAKREEAKRLREKIRRNLDPATRYVDYYETGQDGKPVWTANSHGNFEHDKFRLEDLEREIREYEMQVEQWHRTQQSVRDQGLRTARAKWASESSRLDANLQPLVKSAFNKRLAEVEWGDPRLSEPQAMNQAINALYDLAWAEGFRESKKNPGGRERQVDGQEQTRDAPKQEPNPDDPFAELRMDDKDMTPWDKGIIEAFIDTQSTNRVLSDRRR